MESITWLLAGICLVTIVVVVTLVAILALVIHRRQERRGRRLDARDAHSSDNQPDTPRMQDAIEVPPRIEPAATAAYIPGAAAAASPSELALQFPNLEVIELLGKGGMGAVYKARQPHLDRFVALKLLPAESARDASFAERFAREARAMAKLSHPNIVAIYDFGQSNGIYFLLMEYVDGVNLRQAMRTGLPPDEGLGVVCQLCEALEFAHDEGVVHRDIKPENILLDRRGRVRVADFGLAKLLGPTADTGLTATHQVMGTLHYMAPEQLAGAKTVDHRADIYSLGVTFYEMLTGELPLGRFPPPSRTAGVDARLDAVVLRTLERAPVDRYQHASDIKRAIEAINGAQVIGSAPTESRTNPLAAPGWAAWWRAQTLETRRTVKIMLWVLMLAAAVVFGGVDRSFADNPRVQGQRTERLAIGLIQPWYVSETRPDGFQRSWNLLTVSGAAGVLVLICLSWLIAIGRWEKQSRPPLSPEETRSKVRRAGGWLFATGIVVMLAWLAVLVLLDAVPRDEPRPGPPPYAYLAYGHGIWSLLAGAMIICGGVNMLQIRRYTWAITGSILAMIPLSAGVLLGLPVGIWCLMLLCRREVRDEFQRAAWLAKNREFQSTAPPR